MSYDALVWLLVGLGIGVAASLMLLIGYSMLEYGRLSRRFRRARATTAAAAVAPIERAVPVVPKTSLLARPAAPSDVAARPVAAAKPMIELKPAVDPEPAVDDKPARPALVVVSAPEPKPVAISEPVPAAPVVAAEPTVATPSEPPAMPSLRRAQSVEAMFAEAFAHDRLTVSPEPDEAAGATKPGAEKPPG